MGLAMESAAASSPAAAGPLTTLPDSIPGSFPAPSKYISGLVNSIQTDIEYISFSDKILITISQHGRLAQWVTVPLESDNPTASDPYFQTVQGASSSFPRDGGDDDDDDDNNNDDDNAEEPGLLPPTRLQPRTLLGAGGNDRELLGQLYASQIAHAITTKNPAETRALLLGLGLAKADVTDRDSFLQVMDLVLNLI